MVKLPSGREVSDDILESIAEAITCQAFSLESFDDSFTSFPKDLTFGWGEEGDFCPDDVKFILEAVEPVAKKMYDELCNSYDAIHAKHIIPGLWSTLAEFQMDHYGHFRIMVDGEISDPELYEGVGYLKTKDGREFMAVSQYFGVANPEQVYMMVPVPTKPTKAPVCDLFQPDEPCPHEGKLPV